MSYHVKIESFEGPFELLLALVTQHKVKVGSISISEVADQYIEHIDRMHDLDMDVASEFLVVASTLLAIKSNALLPEEKDKGEAIDDPELEELTLEQTTDLLVTRIITYYQYKRLAAMLGARMQGESMMHPRTAGPDPEFMGLLPDYLENVTLEGLGLVCASLMAKRETFLLDAEHIAAKPIAVETYIDSLTVRLEHERHLTFDQITKDAGGNTHVVGSFLAILEMYKRGMVSLEQPNPGDPIAIDYIDPDRWAEFALDSGHTDATSADAAAAADAVDDMDVGVGAEAADVEAADAAVSGETADVEAADVEAAETAAPDEAAAPDTATAVEADAPDTATALSEATDSEDEETL